MSEETPTATPAPAATPAPTPAPEPTGQDNEFRVDLSSVTPENAPEQSENGAGDYVLNIDPELKVTDEAQLLFKDNAQKFNIPASAASDFVNETMRAIISDERKNFESERTKLKADWGADYSKRIEQTQRFIANVAHAAGLGEDQIQILFSPAGYRLMDAMRRVTSESSFVNAPTAAPREEDTEEGRKRLARAMITDKNNPYWRGFNDPKATTNERLAAYKEYNRLRGMKVWPE